LLKKQGYPVEAVVPKEKAPWNADGIFIPKNQTDLEIEWCHRYINFLLDAGINGAYADALPAGPLNMNSKLSEFLMKEPAIPTTAEKWQGMYVPDDWDLWAENRTAWQEAFVKEVVPLV
jgi:spermidine/putrescine-binding protein